MTATPTLFNRMNTKERDRVGRLSSEHIERRNNSSNCKWSTDAGRGRVGRQHWANVSISRDQPSDWKLSDHQQSIDPSWPVRRPAESAESETGHASTTGCHAAVHHVGEGNQSTVKYVSRRRRALSSLRLAGERAGHYVTERIRRFVHYWNSRTLDTANSYRPRRVCKMRAIFC